MIQKLGRKKEGLLPQEMETSIEQQVASTICNQAALPLCIRLSLYLYLYLYLYLCLPLPKSSIHRWWFTPHVNSQHVTQLLLLLVSNFFLRKYKILADFSICFSSSFSPLNLSLVSDLQFLEYFTKSCITLDLFQHALTHIQWSIHLFTLSFLVRGWFVS